MVIETKYEYKYYTVIHTEQWVHGNEEWFGDGFTWDSAINFINHKFKTSKDKNVNNYRVDHAIYCEGISVWRRQAERHKQRAVFVQFQDDQSIKTIGEGDLFVLYEEEEEEGEEEEEDDEIVTSSPDGYYYGAIDGLAGLGGRL